MCAISRTLLFFPFGFQFFQLRKIPIPVQLPFTFLPCTLQSGFHRITPSQKMPRPHSEQKTESRKEASPNKQFHRDHFFPALLISSIILDPMEPRRSLQNDPPPFLPEPERDRGLLLYIVSGAGRLKSSVSASQEQKEHSQCSPSRVSSSPSLQLGHFGLNSKRHLLHTRLWLNTRSSLEWHWGQTTLIFHFPFKFIF